MIAIAQSIRRRTRGLRILTAVVAAPLALGLGGWVMMFRMPGKRFDETLPPLTERQAATKETLRDDVQMLAGEIGERNTRHYAKLEAAADFIDATLQRAGHEVSRQQYEIAARSYSNLEVEIRGHERPDEIAVVGAHYDSAIGSPGANDNGTGVAALLELARRFSDLRPDRTLRLVAFTNEEMPHFRDGTMGSIHYARRCKQRGEEVIAMFSLETMGCYSDRRGSQRYPFPVGLLYPNRGDFIGFVGNVSSSSLVKTAVASFRRNAAFPSEGAALPSWLPGVGWSDHASFWDQGYPAVMITDTAPFRYPYYHHPGDTPDKVDYARLARVVDGVEAVVRNLLD